MKSLTRSRSLLIFCLAFVVVASFMILRPYASVVAARVSSTSPLLAALVQRFAPQATQQPTRADQQRPATQRQTTNRKDADGQKTEGAPPCDLPAYYDNLSGGGQNAELNRKNCQPPTSSVAIQENVSSVAPAARMEGKPTSEAALTNIQVNNPAADATARNTQSETTLVLAGPNIIASYNDSGSTLAGAHFTGFAVSDDGTGH